MKKKILVVIYNRANYARIKTVLEAKKNHKKLSLHLVLASSSVMYRFGNLDAIVKKDGFSINDKIYSTWSQKVVKLNDQSLTKIFSWTWVKGLAWDLLTWKKISNSIRPQGWL